MRIGLINVTKLTKVRETFNPGWRIFVALSFLFRYYIDTRGDPQKWQTISTDRVCFTDEDSRRRSMNRRKFIGGLALALACSVAGAASAATRTVIIIVTGMT